MAWKREALIYNVDGSFSWSKTHAQVPVVLILENGDYRIYYAARNSKGQSNASFIDVSSEDPKTIKYIHNSVILPLGEQGTFDDCGIMPTCILTIKGLQYLYYIGWTLRGTVPFSNAIGVAVSDDGGKSFKKVKYGPIIGTGPTEPFFTGTCNVIEIDGKFIAYYLSCTGWVDYDNKKEPTYDIKIATSNDGINFKILDQVAIRLEENEGGIASASVIKENGKFHMWFSVRGITGYRTGKDASYRIKHAISNDGFSWDRTSDLNLDISKDGWDSEMTAYPYVIQDQEKLLMFYNGNQFGQSGFGYASMVLDKD
ncbi:hypothetical protein [uncultured Dokdonia sp.]|uniref:hypothetical protein n=1 Tax=uncultured Dokdonia sp. TaxID=575653 RepID=UPI0030EF034B|tara:strand:+ start:45310 stop:46248 length:939 start_codon:yes stop_codon:yes gene_type:complete